MLERSLTTVRVAALLPALLATACSGFGAAPSPPPPPAEMPAASPPPAPAPSTARVEALERQVADLGLQLLEKTEQVDEIQLRLDDARREVVRAMAKLQSLATRAEAASGIAEAELALQSLPESTAGETVTEARQLMESSSAEFDKGNFGGALYLANQAKSAATAARGLFAREQDTPQPGERSLALPLHLETTTGANVREGPGTRFAVMFTLPARTPLVAYSSAQQWLQVTDDSGRRGWINQTLIRGRP